MNNKRNNKYPNNRFTKTNTQRSKKITPHERKEVTEKANRNGFVLETIPANNLKGKSTYHERAESRNFFKDMYAKNGYYHYLWTPFIVLLLTVFADFIIMLIAKSFGSSVLDILKSSLPMLVVSVLLFCINVSAIIFMGLATSKHNIRFGVAGYRIFRIISIVFLFESVLTIIAYFTVFNPLGTMYLIYLIAWNMIKAIIYLVMMSLSYILYFKLKFI
jgi:hypothetical protein